VLANNAVYCDGGSYAISSMTGVTVTGNVIFPATSMLPSSGYRVGRSTAQDLIDAASRNVYPTATSPMIDAGTASWVTALDFNGTARSGVPDAGAYTWTGPSNPGWTVGPGLKGTGAATPPAPPASFRAQ